MQQPAAIRSSVVGRGLIAGCFKDTAAAAAAAGASAAAAGFLATAAASAAATCAARAAAIVELDMNTDLLHSLSWHLRQKRGGEYTCSAARTLTQLCYARAYTSAFALCAGRRGAYARRSKAAVGCEVVTTISETETETRNLL
jgi:hypothetical protein